MAKNTRRRAVRRDRRKAKASSFAREPTQNPKKKGHHLYESSGKEAPGRASGPGGSPCANDPRGHEYSADLERGVIICRFCGSHAKPDEPERKKPGRKLEIPEHIQVALRPRRKPSPKPVFARNCRDHEYVANPDLGVLECSICRAVRKD